MTQLATDAEHDTLFSRLAAPDRLLAAWEKVRQNRGCAGVDGEGIDHFACHAEPALHTIRQSLIDGRYQPQPLLAVTIPKPNGGERLLAVPTVRDRIVQTAAALTLAPLLDAEFNHCSYAYREGRSVQLATAVIGRYRQEGYRHVVDADIRGCFDHIDHQRLLQRVRAVVADPDILRLLGAWLRAEVAGHDGPWCLAHGIPQGSPISPWLANLYLDELDETLIRHVYRIVRYADDFVVLTESRAEAEDALARIRAALDRLGLELNPAKTRLTDFDQGFTFLGCRFQGERIEIVHPPRNPMALPDAAVPCAGAAAPPAPPSPAPRAPAAVEGGAAAGPRRPRLRTLYVLEPGSELARSGQRIVVRRQGGVSSDLPAEQVDAILVFAAASLTTPLMDLCLERGIPIYLLNARGRQFGMVDAFGTRHVHTQRHQFQRQAEAEFGLAVARAIVAAKLANGRLLLRRHARSHDSALLRQAEAEIEGFQREAERAADLDTLRGLEGIAARSYFRALAGLIPAEWRFSGRRKRPPPDPVNAMLSFGYTLLFYNVHALLCSAGLNPALGFLHALRPGHPALASDMVEEFRAPIVDALVLALITRGRIRPDEFSPPASPGEPCLLLPEARKRFIHAFEAKMNDQITLRDGSRLDYRRLIESQVHALAAAVRGSASAYLPYLAR
ncbi:MAG: CRISPR-associated endonuclease Cas1 [Pseudomonadota bacterium]